MVLRVTCLDPLSIDCSLSLRFVCDVFIAVYRIVCFLGLSSVVADNVDTCKSMSQDNKKRALNAHAKQYISFCEPPQYFCELAEPVQVGAVMQVHALLSMCPSIDYFSK